MTRRTWLFCGLALLGTSFLFAEQGIVRTRDGQVLQGEISEKPDSVTVTIHGVQTIVPRNDVESIEMIGSALSDLRARIARLNPQDVPGRVALAREAFDRREYELSRELLDAALAIDPNDTEANRMLGIVQSQLRMERSRLEPVAPGPVAPRPPVVHPPVERRLLTPNDIEAIRRKELKPADRDVRIRFVGDVKRRFAESLNMTFAEFNSKPTVEQALLILERGDASMRDQVRIQSDPPSIREYKTQIQPLVLASCATTGCHGGPPGAGLVLFNSAENDALSYTNFFILQNYARKAPSSDGGAVFGDGAKRMINRGRGDESLLANYGLPIAIAEYDHPLVNGKPITPVFRNKDDAKYRMVVNWMNESLAPFEPQYGIYYTPPTATTLPAPTTQATP
jgi:hypothetical protein